MTDIKTKFRIKYGLAPSEPSDDQVNKFITEVNKLVQSGKEPELAGEVAAKISFPSYQTYKYASQADTLHDLILAIQAKGKR